MRPLTILPLTIALLATGWVAAGAPPADPTGPAADSTPPWGPGRAACDYGIAVAFNGDLARAESVFVLLLARSPGDARALTNLGNINMMRDQPEVAMAFYERAAAADTADAGILLNQATALLLLGETDAAAARAAYATERAGGVREAARLLGLRSEEEDESPKASAKTRLNQEEILSLLRAASTGVPTDSLRVPRGRGHASDSTAVGAKHRRTPVWRSAGARAGDQDIAGVLHWKR